MSVTLNKSLLSKMERRLRQDEAINSSIWFQTAEGEMVEIEYELGWFSPVICQKLESGVGFARGNPICLPPKIAPIALESICHYFRFCQAPGRTDEECELFDDEFLKKDTHTLSMLARAAQCLQVDGLMDMICGALARNIDNGSPEVKQDLLKYFEKSVEGVEMEPQNNLNPNGDLRVRLSKKLLAKQKKELKEVENAKKEEAEVETQKHEDRSIDDLISFINGGDGDTKGVQTLKKKKKNRNKGKEKKKTSSRSALSSSETSASKKVNENREEDIHASASANHSGSTDSLKLLGTQDESSNVEGDAVDNYMDPEKMKEIDRCLPTRKNKLTSINLFLEVEAFARLLNFNKAGNLNKAGIQL